ncbi:MAG: hypothetical protein Kow0029_28830 [Candidatus Rifleibacteriota bacterium]
MKMVTLCYLRKNGTILFIHRNNKESDFHAGRFNGLGEKLEPGETPEE